MHIQGSSEYDPVSHSSYKVSMLEANIYKEKQKVLYIQIHGIHSPDPMQQRNATERPTQQPLSFSTTVFTLEFKQISFSFFNSCVVPVFDKNDKWFAQNISQVSQFLDAISHKHLYDHVVVD